MSYRSKRQHRRLTRQRHVRDLVVVPIAEEQRAEDPLRRGTTTAVGRVVQGAALVGAAAMTHGAVLAAFFGVGLLGVGADAHVKEERLTVAIVQTEPQTEPLPELPAEETELAEATVPTPPPEPKPAAQPRKPKKEKPKPRNKPKKVVDNEPPPDPGDKAEPAEATDPTPRRRIVGLNLESTTTGGSGPSFAVGTSRMGDTAATAADPKIASKAPGKRGTTDKAGSSSPNTIASRLPVAGVKYEKPKRLGKVVPRYPDLLRKQGIEATVTVLVKVAKSGKVTAVTVVKGSRYPEFDRAATEAAKRERFQPATRNGTPIDYRLKYSYRFRLNG